MLPGPSTPIHGVAVAVAIDADGPLAGLLLLGPAGVGKTTLALALAGGCPWRRARLVADDAVLLDVAGGRIVARPPQPLAGRVELRGFGPAATLTLDRVALTAVFDVEKSAPRVQDPAAFPIGEPGPTIPRYAFDVSAVAPAARAREALRAITSGQFDEAGHHAFRTAEGPSKS